MITSSSNSDHFISVDHTNKVISYNYTHCSKSLCKLMSSNYTDRADQLAYIKTLLTFRVDIMTYHIIILIVVKFDIILYQDFNHYRPRI